MQELTNYPGQVYQYPQQESEPVYESEYVPAGRLFLIFSGIGLLMGSIFFLFAYSIEAMSNVSITLSKSPILATILTLLFTLLTLAFLVYILQWIRPTTRESKSVRIHPNPPKSTQTCSIQSQNESPVQVSSTNENNKLGDLHLLHTSGHDSSQFVTKWGGFHGTTEALEKVFGAKLSHERDVVPAHIVQLIINLEGTNEGVSFKYSMIRSVIEEWTGKRIGNPKIQEALNHSGLSNIILKDDVKNEWRFRNGNEKQIPHEFKSEKMVFHADGSMTGINGTGSKYYSVNQLPENFVSTYRKLNSVFGEVIVTREQVQEQLV